MKVYDLSLWGIESRLLFNYQLIQNPFNFFFNLLIIIH